MTDISGTARDLDGESAMSYIYYEKASLKIGSRPGQSAVLCISGDYTSQSKDIALEGQYIGIQVGTGITAVTPTDTALATRIAHGRSAGQLEYGGCELFGIAFSDPNGEFTIRRYFTNASGGSITVNEVGIYSVGCSKKSSGYSWAFLIARDVVSPGVAVLDGEILRVTYVPQITV
ncbi:hypothetical protein ES708_32072 [subsurface metagenome]